MTWRQLRHSANFAACSTTLGPVCVDRKCVGKAAKVPTFAACQGLAPPYQGLPFLMLFLNTHPLGHVFVQTTGEGNCANAFNAGARLGLVLLDPGSPVLTQRRKPWSCADTRWRYVVGHACQRTHRNSQP